MRHPTTAILLLFCISACSTNASNAIGGDGGPPDDSLSPTNDAGEDTDGESGTPSTGVYCTTESPTPVASGGGFSVQTTHYELYAETTSADATELASLLEASADAFSAWFSRSAPPFKMKVDYYKDEASWAAGLAADGISAPSEAGGYYSANTKTAYLFKQGNPYYSHVLLVHEATHQFHDLTRLVGQSIPFWYGEGHAEYLSRHD